MATASFETPIPPKGDSSGLCITGALSEATHTQRSSVVVVAVVEGRLLAKPSGKARSKRPGLPYSRADLIKGMTPAKAHTDELPKAIAPELEE